MTRRRREGYKVRTIHTTNCIRDPSPQRVKEIAQNEDGLGGGMEGAVLGDCGVNGSGLNNPGHRSAGQKDGRDTRGSAGRRVKNMPPGRETG